MTIYLVRIAFLLAVDLSALFCHILRCLGAGAIFVLHLRDESRLRSAEAGFTYQPQCLPPLPSPLLYNQEFVIRP